MTLLSPNQQCQSTDEKTLYTLYMIICYNDENLLLLYCLIHVTVCQTDIKERNTRLCVCIIVCSALEILRCEQMERQSAIVDNAIDRLLSCDLSSKYALTGKLCTSWVLCVFFLIHTFFRYVICLFPWDVILMLVDYEYMFFSSLTLTDKLWSQWHLFCCFFSSWWFLFHISNAHVLLAFFFIHM